VSDGAQTAAVEVVLPIVAVTVQEDRAAITRRGTVKLAAGQHRIAIAGVAPVLADKSLTASASGARVLDVRCERTIAPWREPGSETEPARLRVQRDEHERARADAEARAKVAAAQSTALAQLGAAAWHDLAVEATRGSAATDGVSARFGELDLAARAAAARATDAAFDAELAGRALGRLDARLARAEAEAGTLAARLMIDVIVEANGNGELAFEIGYAVPCAAWRPHHRATLDGSERVVVRTDACVWQATGEDWRDAALTFSLERASLGVEPPNLFDEYLTTRRRAEVLAVETREQDVQTTGLGAAGGAAVVPGIDDGGLGLVLRGTRPVTIRSDGTPHRVAVGEITAPAELALVAMPPVTPWVHVRARFANTGAVPLLAGPVDLVMASGYVGSGELGFVAPGEMVELGFGPEPDVRVHRDERRERDDAGLLGGWNVQTVRVAVRISNLSGTKRKLIVQERVPVSEVEQVELAIAKPGAYAITEAGVSQVTERTVDDRGVVTWNVELPSRARRVVTVEYQIKSRKDVAGL
jgi:uncharacterized protein (TIGR02231 family)